MSSSSFFPVFIVIIIAHCHGRMWRKAAEQYPSNVKIPQAEFGKTAVTIEPKDELGIKKNGSRYVRIQAASTSEGLLLIPSLWSLGFFSKSILIPWNKMRHTTAVQNGILELEGMDITLSNDAVIAQLNQQIPPAK